jgi:hypothetical protein
MKRLGRWLFNLAAGVSLMMWLFAACLWARSGKKCDLLILTHGGYLLQIQQHPSNYGPCIVFMKTSPSWWDSSWIWERQDARSQSLIYSKHATAFTYFYPEDFDARPRSFGDVFLYLFPGFKPQRSSMGFPLHPGGMISATWRAALVYSAILPILFVMFHVVRFRRDAQFHREALCAVCGYDLRATRNRCPECGAIPPWAGGIVQ